MLRAYKTEILPNSKQALKIRQTLGTCRYLYNLYLASNFEVYETLGSGFFVSAFTFDKYVNHVVKKELPWIDDCGAKARKQAMCNAERAFKTSWKEKQIDRSSKGNVSRKSKPTFRKMPKAIGQFGGISCKYQRLELYASKKKAICRQKQKSEAAQFPTKPVVIMYLCLSNCRKLNQSSKPQGEGIGIDLGVKELAVMSNGEIKPNINKTPRVKKLDKKLRREQRRLSRKYESKKKRGEQPATYSANIERQVVKIQRLYQTLTNIRMDYENKIIAAIMRRDTSIRN